MRLALINNFYPPFVVGGAELFTSNLAEALSSRGHEVAVVTTCAPDNQQRQEKLNGVDVFRFFPKNIWWNFERFKEGNSHSTHMKLLWNMIDLWNRNAGRHLRSYLQQLRPDVIHTNNIKGFSPIIWHEARQLSIPIIHTAHDYQMLCWRGTMVCNSNGSNCWGCSTYSTWYKWHSRAIDLFCSPSEFLLQRHCGLGLKPKASTVIRNGVPGAVPTDGPDGLGISSTPLKLLYLGQLTNDKGIAVLLEALRTIPDVPLDMYIAGRGKMEALVREAALADKRIQFHGFVEGSRKRDLLAQCEMLVVPSTWPENAPLTVAEGLSNGLGVVASQIGALPEMIHHESNGLLVPPDDPAALAQTIRRLAASPNDVSRMRHEALSSSSELSFDKMVDRYVAAYAGLTGSYGRATP
jgi:glycosyltransferase involved in cell wall biosynthesis